MQAGRRRRMPRQASQALQFAAGDQFAMSSAPPTSVPLTKTIGKVGQPVHIFKASGGASR